MPKDSPIQSVADLKGKKVGLNKGSNVHFLLVRALESAGIGYDEIEPAFLPPADARAAFASGAIDAWAIWDPFQASAEQTLGARVLTDADGPRAQLPVLPRRPRLRRRQPRGDRGADRLDPGDRPLDHREPRRRRRRARPLDRHPRRRARARHLPPELRRRSARPSRSSPTSRRSPTPSRSSACCRSRSASATRSPMARSCEPSVAPAAAKDPCPYRTPDGRLA